MIDLIGDLLLGEQGPAIGSLHWLSDHTHMRSSDLTLARQFRLVTELDHLRLEKIEQARGDGPPSFWLHLWPTIIQCGVQLNAKVSPIRIDVPRDNWLAVLAESQHARLQILELELPKLEDVAFRKAVTLIRRAQDALDEGNYFEVSIRCRSALQAGEQAFNQQGLKNGLAAVRGEVWGRTYTELIKRFRDAMSLEAHPLDVTHTREEAQFFLRASICLLALLSRIAGGRK